MPFGIKQNRLSVAMRIALLFSATFALGLIAAFATTYFQIETSLEDSNRSVIFAKVREASTVLEAEGVKGLQNFLSEEKNRIVNASFMIRVFTAQGENLYLKPSVQEKNFDFDELLKIKKPLKDILGWHALSAINDEDKFDVLTERVGNEYYLQIGKSSEDREEILERMLQVFIITGGLISLLSIGVGLRYAKKSLARIEKLNQMMRESLDNVAHDIRTPLTRIRAVAEDALLSKNQELLREALEDCAESTQDISGLVDQLMSISEAEAGTLVLRYEVTNVRDLLEDVAEIYEFVSQDKNIDVAVLPPDEGLQWNLDRKRVKQALGNLLDNAIKFSPRDTKILISAKVSSQFLKISVKDQGPGIPKEDLGRVWDRLFRGDKSRSTKGLGLGLSIVRSIAIAHKGRVEASAVPEGGMNFSILIPRAP